MNHYSKKFIYIESVGQFCIDSLALALGMFLAWRLRFPNNDGAVTTEDLWMVGTLMLVVGVLYHLITGSYGNLIRRGFWRELWMTFGYAVSMFVLTGFYVYAFRQVGEYSRLLLGYTAMLTGGITLLLHMLFKYVMRHAFRKGKESEKVLIVTTEAAWSRIRARITSDAAWTYQVTGIVLVDINCAKDSKVQELDGYPVVAGCADAAESAKLLSADSVLFYCANEYQQELHLLMESFLAMGMTVYDCIERLDVEVPTKNVGRFADIPVITYSIYHFDNLQRIVKRAMDLLGGVLGSVLVLLFSIPIGIAIKLDSPGPVFFAQERIGKNGRRFKMLKYRSMYMDAEAQKAKLMEHNEMQGPVFKMHNDPRITKVGAFLRATSLDELPQFINILKGDMSLVGTRPPTVQEFEQYTQYYRRRLSITPGLTGLWQVSGRSEITSFDEIVRLDLEYIDHWNIGQDCKILIRTLGVVLLRRGSK